MSHLEESWAANAHIELYLESWSNAARTLHLRGTCIGGPFAESHATNADRSRAASTYQLHGLPVSLQISPGTAPVRRGECYVRATLLIDGEPIQRLVSAYLTDGKTLSWPPGILEGFTEGPGYVHEVTGTNPAANAEISEAVPTNAVWKLKGLRLTLTTDGNAANRNVQMRFGSGVAFFNAAGTGYNHPASTVVNYIIGEGLAPTGTITNMGEVIGILRELMLAQGFTIETVTTNMQAGDDYATPRLMVEEWIQE